MLMWIFGIMMLMVFGRLTLFAIRATWGITKIFFSIILLPLILVGLVFQGLLFVAFPILLLVGVVAIFALD